MPKKPVLHYSNSNYSTDPITDINPLLLQKYNKHKVLVLCAREGQCVRINKMALHSNNQNHNQSLVSYGWWDSQRMGLVTNAGEIDEDKLYSYDAIILLDKHRIDKVFTPLVEAVERRLM